MVERWRLIDDDNRSAALNMAVDEAIMRMCASGDSPPTVRLYGWEKPAISIGFHQSLQKSEINTDYCERTGIDLVRRPTGGRAVLHGHDLTFCIAINEEDLPPHYRKVLDSHLWLMSGIQRGLNLLGMEADIGPENGSTRDKLSADCFAHIAPCDLRIETRKVAGAAQVRKWGALLEQGSIPCKECSVDYIQIFGNSSANQAPLRVSFMSARQAVSLGITEVFEVILEPSAMSQAEIDLAQRLSLDKYSNEKWTYDHCRICVDNRI